MRNVLVNVVNIQYFWVFYITTLIALLLSPRIYKSFLEYFSSYSNLDLPPTARRTVLGPFGSKVACFKRLVTDLASNGSLFISQKEALTPIRAEHGYPTCMPRIPLESNLTMKACPSWDVTLPLSYLTDGYFISAATFKRAESSLRGFIP